jgi:hypothetical protein
VYGSKLALFTPYKFRTASPFSPRRNKLNGSVEPLKFVTVNSLIIIVDTAVYILAGDAGINEGPANLIGAYDILYFLP